MNDSPPSPSVTKFSPVALLVLGVLLVINSHAQLVNSYHQISILTEDTDETSRALLRLAVNCDEEIQRFVGRRPALTTLYILPDKQRNDLRPGMYFCGIDTKAPSLQVTYDLIRMLLYRQAVDLRTTQNALQPKHVPDWLVAAIHSRVMLEETPFSTRDIYAGFRLQAERNQLPEWQRVVDRPLTPHLPVFYQLYAESALCFLNLLRREDSQTVRRILLQLAPERSSSDGLIQLFPDQLGRKDASQEWFRAEMTNLAYRVDQPGSFELIRDELMKIERVTIMIPGDSGGFTVRQVLLEEVPDYLKRYDYSRYNLGGMIKDIFMLMQNCPYVVRQSLIMYIEAIEQLRNGNTAAFTEEIRAARRAFGESYIFGTNARKYLLSQEQERNSAGVRLFAFLNSKMIPTYTTDFEKRVDSLLDQMELQLNPLPAAPSVAYKKKME